MGATGDPRFLPRLRELVGDEDPVLQTNSRKAIEDVTKALRWRAAGKLDVFLCRSSAEFVEVRQIRLFVNARSVSGTHCILTWNGGRSSLTAFSARAESPARPTAQGMRRYFQGPSAIVIIGRPRENITTRGRNAPARLNLRFRVRRNRCEFLMVPFSNFWIIG